MSVNGRILSSNSTILLWLVAIAVMIVGLISFILSFTSLTALAAMARIPDTVAWGWPLMVDGTIVVATFGTLVLRTRDRVATRGYPWAVLIVFGALSIYANGVHATGSHIGSTEAFIVGAVAPFALLTSTHLLVLMLTSPEKEPTDSDLRREADRRTPASEHPSVTVPSSVSVAPSPSRLPGVAADIRAAGALNSDAVESVNAPAGNIPGPVRRRAATLSPLTEAAVEKRVLAYRSEHGKWPSGGTVGSWLGKSAKTGVRFVNRLKDEHEPARD